MTTLDTLKAKFPDGFTTSAFRDNQRVVVAADKVFAVLECLKTQCGFDFLADLAGIDYLGYPNATDRYAVVYALTNLATGERLFVKTVANDPEPMLPSVYSLWKGADWMEREVYDMFGVVFDGHPDLRRILMPSEYTSHPLRKDYPLRGAGERHNFPTVTRAES
ncbi:MAG TPA: NADH-quinone oxidoreductase subunit C [Gemmataceae bacterium]|nr:NADH-quinone oxidoreductase subunit C [Gemmataceae bacterium]